MNLRYDVIAVCANCMERKETSSMDTFPDPFCLILDTRHTITSKLLLNVLDPLLPKQYGRYDGNC